MDLKRSSVDSNYAPNTLSRMHSTLCTDFTNISWFALVILKHPCISVFWGLKVIIKKHIPNILQTNIYLNTFFTLRVLVLRRQLWQAWTIMCIS